MDKKIKHIATSMDDMVFEGRNKSYGAYFIRKIQSKTQLIALISILFLFVLFSYSPKILSLLSLSHPELPILYDTSQVILIEPPSGNPLNEVKPPSSLNDVAENSEPTETTKKDDIIPDSKNDQSKNNGQSSGDTSSNKNQNNPGSGLNGNGDVFTMNNVDLPPVYKGGDDALESIISSNLKYPEGPRIKGLEGVVMVVFIVEKDGSISNLSVQGRNDKELEAEAIRVVSLTNGNWIPASKRRLHVRCVCKMPISFSF
ncbi:MAG: TonB family protein [Bacteroidia bacterium]|nr:TonB family protein [Bacteroidia bacterium]